MSPNEPTSTMTESRSSVAETASEPPETVISWGPIEYGRLRSVIVGGGVAFVLLFGWGVLLNLPAVLSSSVPVDTLLVVAVLLLVGGPFSFLYWLVAYRESTDSERESLKQELGQLRPDWSWLRPGWITVGAVATGGLLWWVGDGPVSFVTLAPALVGISSILLFNTGRFWYSLDPEAGTLKLRSSRADRTWMRAFEWTVGYRRLDLGSLSLFVCSNRGKQWYEGTHLLPVPREQADTVDDALRKVAEGTPPRRVKRDERILFGAIGTSMIGIGPLLYLLSNEPALLMIVAGPSGLVGVGLIVHALRG